MAARDTVGYSFVTAGLVLTATGYVSGAADILTTALRVMSVDKTTWPTKLQNKIVKEFWFKSSVIVTISQDVAGTAGLVTFAANTWWNLPIEGFIENSGAIKGANNTNTTEYFFVLGD